MPDFSKTPAPPTRISVSDNIASGAISDVIRLPVTGASISAVPVSGGTMRVFKSSSPWEYVALDVADGSLSYANLIAGTQPTKSVWMLWKAGAVTATTNERPIESAGDVAVVALSTTQAGILEVAG